MQEMLGSRQSEHEESRRRLGITRELVWLVQTRQEDTAITYMEADDPLRVLTKLAASNLPFDRWFREQIREFYGFDLAQSPLKLLSEQVLEWRLPFKETGEEDDGKDIRNMEGLYPTNTSNGD